MAGGNVDPLIIDETHNPNRARFPSTTAPMPPLGGANSRIVLATPTPPPVSSTRGNVEDTLYEGWLYAAVADPSGNTAVYLTKDFGQTWTQLKLSTLPDTNAFPILANPTNDQTQPNYNVAGDGLFPEGTYNISVAVDPTNPNVL